VRIVGRRRATITRGGVEIHQREAAERHRTYPAVDDVRVISVPHGVLGELVCARIGLVLILAGSPMSAR
jgi:fatty-acyl-CoA synthase